jgi:hypothetical protein
MHSSIVQTDWRNFIRVCSKAIYQEAALLIDLLIFAKHKASRHGQHKCNNCSDCSISIAGEMHGGLFKITPGILAFALHSGFETLNLSPVALGRPAFEGRLRQRF